jgi:hypothetical protein
MNFKTFTLHIIIFYQYIYYYHFFYCKKKIDFNFQIFINHINLIRFFFIVN